MQDRFGPRQAIIEKVLQEQAATRRDLLRLCQERRYVEGGRAVLKADVLKRLNARLAVLPLEQEISEDNLMLSLKDLIALL